MLFIKTSTLRPANILLSQDEIPVLVDFGFAERCSNFAAPTSFQSNLAYGTPEYLSPERARGTLHDTRKSDIYSLGITFFEILVGRTPFEDDDGCELSTPIELERYWEKSNSGMWLGEWNMSAGTLLLFSKHPVDLAHMHKSNGTAIETNDDAGSDYETHCH
jgi:serine/threonine protein kinase